MSDLSSKKRSSGEIKYENNGIIEDEFKRFFQHWNNRLRVLKGDQKLAFEENQTNGFYHESPVIFGYPRLF